MYEQITTIRSYWEQESAYEPYLHCKYDTANINRIVTSMVTIWVLNGMGQRKNGKMTRSNGKMTRIPKVKL